MVTVTLYPLGKAHDYANAHGIAISPAGVLTFYCELTEGVGQKPRAMKFQTSVPFTIREEIASE